MELLIGIVALVVIFGLIHRHFATKAQADDAAAAPYKIEDRIVTAVTTVADVNKDGKVDAVDAKEVVNKVAKAVVKKTTAPKKPAAKPVAKPAKNPAAKKAPAKKTATPKK